MRLFVILGLAGCDQVIGLARHPDAAVANHDEDDDGIDDAIDLCPTHADPTQPQLDEDLDGIGDACDPRPTDPRDRRVYFSPLLGLAPGTWIENGGVWVFEGDGVRQTLPTLDGDFYARLDLGALTAPTVEVVIDDIVSPHNNWDAGVFLIVNGDRAGGGCYVVFRSHQLRYFDNRDGQSVEVPGPTLVGSGRLRVRLHASVEGGPPRCLARWDAQPLAAVDAMPTTPPLTGADAALYTFQGTATFQSIEVFDVQ